jgi:hypothetical protein
LADGNYHICVSCSHTPKGKHFYRLPMQPVCLPTPQEVFSWLPVAHCINESVLVMHGGLSCRDGVTLDDIRDLRRGGQPDREGLMCDLLWSDPQVRRKANL